MRGLPKGEYGYLMAGMKREWIKALLLFCVSAALLLAGMIITKHMHPDYTWGRSRNNLLTVAAVLGVLPAARFLISAIMFSRAVKCSCPAELHEKLKSLEAERRIAYDLYLTAYQDYFPLYVVLCTDNEIAGLICGDTSLAAKGEAHIREALARDGKTHVTVKLFTDESAFLRRVENASSGGEASTELRTLLCQISL